MNATKSIGNFAAAKILLFFVGAKFDQPNHVT